MDIRMCLETGTTRPFRKPLDSPSYINTQSNHPPSVIKSVPKTVENRLSMLSSSKEIFDQEKVVYEEALKRCGHKVKLQCHPQLHHEDKKKRKRRRIKRVTYFCPPFSKNVKTNIGAKLTTM